MPKYTVIGYYQDNHQRFCGSAEGADWVEAVQNVEADPRLIIVEVIEGQHMGLTESMYVESMCDFPVQDEEEDDACEN